MNEYAYAGILTDIISIATRTGGGLHRDTITMQTIPFDTLLSALVNGYVVEKSAEELEREAHDKIRMSYEHRSWPTANIADQAYMEGVEVTLNTLGIKIEGVNA